MSLHADLIFTGGRIFTGEQLIAGAVAVRRGIIEAVGEPGDILNLAGPETKTIRFDGLLLPAFSDLHTHFTLGALALDEVDLHNSRGREDARAAVQAVVETADPGEWITGGYWNDEAWSEAPDRSWLDDISPNNPVLLYRHDLHQALCNAAALDVADLLKATTDPEGGHLGRYDDGTPNGLVFERAMTIVRDCVPAPSFERRRRALRAGMRLLNSLGITSVGEMIDGPEDVEFYWRIANREQLTCRFELLPPLPQREAFIAAGLRSNVGVKGVRLGPMKGFMDGSLGSRTAHMSKPYADDPNNCGYPLKMADPPEKLLEMMREAASHGFACAIHAIGDEANRRLLDLFEKLRAETPRHLRHRVEHAQHLTDELLPRFAELDLTVSMQPAHLVYDALMAAEALGPEREKTCYRFRSLLDAGARVMFNTDWPVVEPNPLTGIAAAVTRCTAENAHPGGWLPNEKIALTEALRAYTAAPAHARKLEDSMGKIEEGFEAGLCLLDRDLFTIAPEEIAAANIVGTWSRGERVYGEG